MNKANGRYKCTNSVCLLERPNLFAICNNTFSKWWEGLRMSCRRVLGSTPLLVRGSETGEDSWRVFCSALGNNNNKNSVALVCKRTMPTERPPTFADRGVSHSQHGGSPMAVLSDF
jgi:hypothetical protein